MTLRERKGETERKEGERKLKGDPDASKGRCMARSLFVQYNFLNVFFPPCVMSHENFCSNI